MGLVSAGLGLINVAGKVVSGVTKLGTGALSLGGKFIKSPIGKIVLGAGAIACLTSDPQKEDGLFSKIREGFSSLWEKVSGFFKEKTVDAAAKTMTAGQNIKTMSSEFAKDNPDSPVAGIMDYIGSGVDAAQEAVPTGAQFAAAAEQLAAPETAAPALDAPEIA